MKRVVETNLFEIIIIHCVSKICGQNLESV